MSTSTNFLLIVSVVAVVPFIVVVECRSYENGLIFYDLKSHRPYLPPTVSVSRGRILANVKFSNMGSIWSTFGRRCDCVGAKCGCCAGVSVKQYKFDQKMCANVTYIPRREEALLEVYLNEKPSAMYGVSVRNPSPFCIPVMMGLPMAMCIQMTDISVVGNNLNMCMDFVVRLATTDLFEMHFQCMRMGVDGFQYLDHNGQPVIPPGSNTKDKSEEQNDENETEIENNEEQSEENQSEEETEDEDIESDGIPESETDIEADKTSHSDKENNAYEQEEKQENEEQENEEQENEEQENEEQENEDQDQEDELTENHKPTESENSIAAESNINKFAEENDDAIVKEEEISPIATLPNESNATISADVASASNSLPSTTIILTTTSTLAPSSSDPNMDISDAENSIDDHENETDKKLTQSSDITDEADIAQSYDTSNAIELSTMQVPSADMPNESFATTDEPHALVAIEVANEVDLNSTISTFIESIKSTEATTTASTITTTAAPIIENFLHTTSSSTVSSVPPVARRKRLPKLYRRSRG